MTTFQCGALSALDVEERELALEVLVGVLRVRDPRGVPALGAVRVVDHLAQAEHLLAEPRLRRPLHHARHVTVGPAAAAAGSPGKFRHSTLLTLELSKYQVQILG